MAIRNIRTEGDPILRKKSKTVEKIDERVALIGTHQNTNCQHTGCDQLP